MLIPYKTDVYIDEEPTTNIILIITIIVFYLLTLIFGLKNFTFMFLSKDNIILGSLLVYFVHGGFLHLLGNILFLWTFGNSINSRVGNLPYLFYFFLLGILSGFFHLIIDGAPAIGSSGAISGIVGMFLILFPKNKIQCIWIIFYSGGKTEFSALFLIILWFLYDLIGTIYGSPEIAYAAHLGGTIFGFSLTYFLIKYKYIVLWNTDKPLFD